MAKFCLTVVIAAVFNGFLASAAESKKNNDEPAEKKLDRSILQNGYGSWFYRSETNEDVAAQMLEEYVSTDKAVRGNSLVKQDVANLDAHSILFHIKLRRAFPYNASVKESSKTLFDTLIVKIRKEALNTKHPLDKRAKFLLDLMMPLHQHLSSSWWYTEQSFSFRLLAELKSIAITLWYKADQKTMDNILRERRITIEEGKEDFPVLTILD